MEANQVGRRVELVATIGIVVIACTLWAYRRGVHPPPTPAGAVALEQDAYALPRTDLPMGDTLATWYELGHVVGEETAAVRIIEFGTFTCTFCGQLAVSLDSIRRRFPGMIAVRWLHYIPEGPRESELTSFMALTSECLARVGRFEAFYELTLLEGRTFSSLSSVLSDSIALGIQERAKFLACMDSPATREILVRHATVSRALGVAGTPAWFLDGKLFVGAMPMKELEALIVAAMRSKL